MKLFLFLRRFRRRLSYTFRWREMWRWEYESCNRCGSCYRLPIGWQQEKWIAINEIDDGCLCADCALTIAQEKDIPISLADMERVSVFAGDRGHGFYIHGPTGMKKRRKDWGWSKTLLCTFIGPCPWRNGVGLCQWGTFCAHQKVKKPNHTITKGAKFQILQGDQ